MHPYLGQNPNLYTLYNTIYDDVDPNSNYSKSWHENAQLLYMCTNVDKCFGTVYQMGVVARVDTLRVDVLR